MLAHAAYGSFGRHRVDSVGVVADLQNIWCDTCAICALLFTLILWFLVLVG